MLTEEQKRMHRVCFTGHRPEKLKQSESVIVKALETAIKEAIADGKNVFISGMARGVDIGAAEIVLRLRKEGANVKLICASPYEGFERGWSAEWQRRYNVILAAADLVRFICPGYSSYNIDLCGYPHEEEEILPPKELIQQYQEKRASLNADIDRILAQITDILGIDITEEGDE